MSASGSSASRKRIRSRRRREKISNERSKRPSDSTTMGTRWFDTLLIGCTLHATARLRIDSGWEAAMEIEREVVVPETPDEVWEALTEPERLEEWFASEAELDARPGGEGVFRWGNGEERRATVREASE